MIGFRIAFRSSLLQVTGATIAGQCWMATASFGGRELPDAANPAEAPLATMEIRHRGAQILGAEIRPQGIDEAELGIGGFPQQKVRQSFLAARADEQIDVL